MKLPPGRLKVWINDDGLIFMEQNKPSFFDIISNERLVRCFHPLFFEQNVFIYVSFQPD